MRGSHVGGHPEYDGVEGMLKHKDDLSSDYEAFPSIGYPDILNYLLFAPSPVTKQELKNYRSLESYNHFVCEWVKEVCVYSKPDMDNVIITGRVFHSQRLSETPPSPWIIADKSGSILSAHCNCMAGLGESCSHVSAVLFYLDYAVRLRDSKTVTEKKAYWTIPGALKGIEYSEIKDIDFTSPKRLKKQLEKKCMQLEEKELADKCQGPFVPSGQEMAKLFSEVNNSGTKSSILSIVPPYSKQFIPKALQNIYPKLLSELYDLANLNKNFIEILNMAKTVDTKVTPAQVAAVEKETSEQSSSKAWFRFRAGRVTASKLHAVCRTDPSQPSLSLIKSICYPENNKFWSKQTEWGCKHEKKARDEYVKCQKGNHENFNIQDSGLFISLTEPHIAATPDALVSCDCCGYGCLEIKCPFCVKDQFIFEALDPNDKSKICLAKIDGEVKLIRTHPYFYQIQAQLFCTNRKYGDFFNWMEKDWHLERITFDGQFFNECIEKSHRLFTNAILVEMLGKFYSQPRTTKVLKCPRNETLGKTYCYCEGPDDGPMIACDNEHCPYEWFHMKCLNLKQVPKRKKWFCPDCTLSKELNKLSKKKR
eukprot:gene2736-3161_t